MKAIDHLNRYVSNVEIFINFYSNVLQYELIDEGIKVNGKKYAILKGDGHELFISEKEDFNLEEEQNFRHIGYYIENVDELLEVLKKRDILKKSKKL